jgi:hypothetical protein
MTTTPALPTDSPRTDRRHRGRRTAILSGTLLALGLAVAQPASAAERPRNDLKTIRSCDVTACLVAWGVVDSDGDGVSNADERMAGTDPHDPNSRPPMTHLAELLVARQLPSFEAGLATFQVMPAEIMAMRGDEVDNPLTAFPLGGRKDSLTRLGISAETMAASGVDPGRTGFTLGLDHPSKDGGLPPVRLGGIAVNLISAGEVGTKNSTGDDLAPLVPPGVRSTSMSGDFTWTTYKDGSKDTTQYIGNDTTVGGHQDKDGNDEYYWKETVSRTENADGSTTTTLDREVIDTKGDVVSETHVVEHKSGDYTTTVTTTTKDVRDSEGNKTGTETTSTVTVKDGDGKVVAEGSQKTTCDAAGENCTSGYINADAESDTIITPEMIVTAEGKLGSTIRTVEGWDLPSVGAAENPNDPGLIMLVDAETAMDYTVLTPMRVTEAQPEMRSDLPNPVRDGTFGGGAGAGCEGLC